MRKWARANLRKHRNLPRCPACSERIPKHEPDVLLRHAQTGEWVTFHERCQGAAYVLPMIEGPGVWHVVHRHIDEELN